MVKLVDLCIRFGDCGQLVGDDSCVLRCDLDSVATIRYLLRQRVGSYDILIMIDKPIEEG